MTDKQIMEMIERIKILCRTCGCSICSFAYWDDKNVCRCQVQYLAAHLNTEPYKWNTKMIKEIIEK